MPNPTNSPEFAIYPISPDEWRTSATGELALPPGFWEGPGASLQEAKVTALGAFTDQKLLGFIAVREVPLAGITPETKFGLLELVARRRQQGKLGAGALAAIESSETANEQTAAHNIAFALVRDRGKGVGTALTRAALAFAGRDATPERPVPAYLSVATNNPAAHLYERLGFEPLTGPDATPLTRMHDYYLPPSPDGQYQAPSKQAHVLMGTVTEGTVE